MSNSRVIAGLSFTSTDGGAVKAADLPSLTTTATITHPDVSNVTNFDFNLSLSPEPISIALLGLGLLFAGFATRRIR